MNSPIISVLFLAWYYIYSVVAGVPVTHCHDETFVPVAVFRVTAENKTQSCLGPKEVVLVNGTSPGPELRIREGKVYWIRVYNDMVDKNLTMVHTVPHPFYFFFF